MNFPALLERIEALEAKVRELEDHQHDKGSKYSPFTRGPIRGERASYLMRFLGPG